MAFKVEDFDVIRSARGVMEIGTYYNEDNDTVTGAGYFNSVADTLGTFGFMLVRAETGAHHLYPYSVAAGVVTLGAGLAIAA